MEPDIDIIHTLNYGDGYTLQAIRGWFDDQLPSGSPSWEKDRDSFRTYLCHFVLAKGGNELAPRIGLKSEFCKGKGRKLLELIAASILQVSRYRPRLTDRPARLPVYQDGFQFVGREKRTMFVCKDGSPSLDTHTLFCLDRHFYMLLPDGDWTRRLLNVIAKHLFIISTFGESNKCENP